MDRIPEIPPVPAQAADAHTRRLTIDYEVGVEPLTGTVHSEHQSFPFAGWLSLASVLGKATAPSTRRTAA